MVFKYFFRGVVGWVGWLEKWGLKLISTQVVVEVEVGVELGNNFKKSKYIKLFYMAIHNTSFATPDRNRSCSPISIPSPEERGRKSPHPIRIFPSHPKNGRSPWAIYEQKIFSSIKLCKDVNGGSAAMSLNVVAKLAFKNLYASGSI